MEAREEAAREVRRAITGRKPTSALIHTSADNNVFICGERDFSVMCAKDTNDEGFWCFHSVFNHMNSWSVLCVCVCAPFLLKAVSPTV